MLKRLGHVVGDIDDPPIESRVAGIEHVIADLLPVEVELGVADARDVNASRADGLADAERAAQVRRRRRRRDELFYPADPFAFPVGGVEQAHVPRRGIAPRGSVIVRVPDPHLPRHVLARNERLSRVGNVRLLAGDELAGVP